MRSNAYIGAPFNPSTITTMSDVFQSSRPRFQSLFAAAAIVSFLAVSTAASLAAIIPIGNASFETPDVSFAGSFDAPGNSPAPWGFTGGAQQIGAFDNTPSGSGDHIDNVDGSQVAFMFPGASNTLFQDLSGPGATFEIGETYVFTIGAGGSSALPPDAELQLRLYYRDGLNNKVTVATSSFDFDPLLDPGSINHLYDYSVISLPVQAGDAWVGQNIGVEIATPGSPAFAYWDLDKARLTSVPEPSTMVFGGICLVGFALRRNRAKASIREPGINS